MDNSGIGDSQPEVGEPPKKVCTVCQAPAIMSCSDDHGVFYCSIEHQKSHWKEHKKDCPPIRVITSPELGPHFVATRDLPPWTLLLTELPVLVNPLVVFEDVPPSCISCRSILPPAPWTCPKCATPFFCNITCSKNKVHSEFECRILSKCSEEQRHKLCLKSNLGYLRALHLKISDSETWGKVLGMRGVYQYISENLYEDEKWFIREILPLIGEKGVGFEEDIAKLWGIYQQKGFLVHPSGNSPKEDHGESFLLYLEGSNFVQNCFPNCTTILGKGSSFQMQVRNAVEVKKGQILSIDFVGISYLMGAMFRQHKIFHDIKGILCICPRCTDPTELGTMLSAVKCTQPDCKDGYLLPVDVSDMAENAIWHCNRAGCEGKGCTWAEIKEITTKVEGDLVTFQKNASFTDIVRILEFWETLKKSLHPNHYIVYNFENDSVNKINEMIGRGMKFNHSRLDLHTTMLEHLLQMANLVNPGLSLTRARLLVLLFIGLNQRLSWSEVRHRPVERELLERTLIVIDQCMPFAKFYPGIVTPNIQCEMQKRRMMDSDSEDEIDIEDESD